MDLTTFIISYFLSKNIYFIRTFFCLTPNDQLKFQHKATAQGFRVSLEISGSSLRAEGRLREGVVLDTTCGGAREVVEYATRIRAFNHRLAWLLIQPENFNSSLMEELLDSAAILPDADVLWISIDTILDIYRINEFLPLATMTLDFNTSATQQQMAALSSRLPTAASRRKDLKNVSLDAAVVLTEPQNFKGWDDLETKQIDTFPKFTYPLLMELAQDINIRYNMLQVDRYGVGINGTFTGLAGLLQRQRVEIGVASMFMRGDRWPFMHYSSETARLRGAFIFKQPPQSAVSNVFLLPFSRGVWLASFLVFLLSGGFVAVFSRRLIHLDPSLDLITPGESVTFTVGAICQQGFSVSPNLMSIRVAMFITLLTSVFAFTSYSAKIVVILQTPSDAIQSIGDLARSPIACGAQDTTYKKVYFKESSNPEVKNLYQRKIQPQGDGAFFSVVDGIQKMRTSFFAFQVETSSGYEIISKTFEENEKCGLKEIEAYRIPMPSVPLRKQSGFRDIIAARLRWQREVGILSRYSRIWLTAKPRCDSEGAGFVTVGLRDCLPVIKVLVYGAAVATVVLAAEIFVAKIKLRKKKETKKW